MCPAEQDPQHSGLDDGGELRQAPGEFTPSTIEHVPGWSLLAHVVRARRQRLGLRQHDLTKNGGPSYTTVQSIERGTLAVSNRILAKMDTCLSWPPGTAECLVHANIPEATEHWDDFIAVSINDTRQSDKDTIADILNRKKIVSIYQEIEQMNSYLLFLDYHFNTLKNSIPQEYAQELVPLEDCVHNARALVLSWMQIGRGNT